MSVIIHKVLFEKLSRHAEWMKFRETLRVVTGCSVELLKEKGKRKDLAANIDMRGIHVGSLAIREHGMEPPAVKACQHLLELAAERFSSILSESNVHDHEHLPAAILSTCSWIRSRALTEDVRLCEAAEACGMSASHLSRLFHRTTGMTFQNYVTRFRLEKATGLLTWTDKSITNIAFDSGFQSLSQFHRSFKAVHKMRPRDYRRKHRSAGVQAGH